LIKKEKKQHNANEEVQLLIAELKEANNKQKKLQKQLQQAGINIAEDVLYAEAKMQVGWIVKRMGEIGSSNVIHPDKAEQAGCRENISSLSRKWKIS
jgi:multidrug resistance efflux pump